MNVLNRIRKRVKKDGLLVTGYLGGTVLAAKLKKNDKNKMYADWIAEYENDILQTEPLAYNPLISVIVPVYNVQKDMLIACIESVKAQTYINWELCLVDDASTMPEVKETLEQYKAQEKIKIQYREKNGHISRTTNDGLQMAEGEYIGLLDCDDILSPNALYEMVKKLNEDAEYDFIYSDEDMLTEDGKTRYNPVFKTEWAPDTFMSVMYTNHFSIFKRSIAMEIGGYRVGYEGSQDYDFVLRFTEKTRKIGHVSKILYHWRSRAESVASNPETKMYAYEAAMKAKKDALERRGLQGEVEYQKQIYQSRVFYKAAGNPKISIIVPSKDNYTCIKTCFDSIVEKTTYPNYEVILIDNGSTEENKAKYQQICDKYGFVYAYHPMEFNFSRMCNLGAKKATGEYYLFLNDDTEVLVTDWLERMVGQAALGHAGAIGAKLYYPEEKRLQHIGIVNRAEGPSHYYCGGREILTDYKMQMDCNYIAVTGACLMLSKDKFEEIGGFEESLPIAYNDVDLCFKLVEKGYYNVVRNDVQLYHYESVSRGNDIADKAKRKRLEQERALLYTRHPLFDKYDPFYSENMELITNMEGLGSLKPKHATQLTIKKSQLQPIDTEMISSFMNISVFEHMKQIKFEGWFYWKNYSHNNLNSYAIILISEKGTAYRYKAQKNYHDPNGDGMYKGNPKLTGFLLAAYTDTIPVGTYKVIWEVARGITQKKYYYEEEKEVEI